MKFTRSPWSRNIVPAIVAIVLITIAGCTYELVHNGNVNQPKADRVQVDIQQIRDLNFVKPVPLVVENRDQAQHEMEAEIARQVSDREFDVEGEAGSLIGIYPRGVQLKRQTMSMLRDQVAGFYDPDTGHMVLVNGAVDVGIWDTATQFMMQKDVVGDLLLAHELTHALQDQHFGIERKLDALKHDDDRALALKSVAEGDATLAGFGFLSGGLDAEKVDTVISRLSDLPNIFAAKAKNVPEGLRAPLAFQYSVGVKFVGLTYKRGGWSAVDGLYRHPPQSSQQLLHPALYFEHPTPPNQISIEGYQSLLPGWVEADNNCMGELMLNVILKSELGKDSPKVSLAEHWTGDRLVILTKGSDLSVIWLLGFKEEYSASQFAAAYVSALDRRLSAVPHRIDYQSDLVLVVIGPAASAFAELAPRIFSKSEVKPLPPPIPPLGLSNSFARK